MSTAAMNTADLPRVDTHSPEDNLLLAALSGLTLAHLRPYLKLVHLAPGKVLDEPNNRMQHVYFPTDATVSLLHVLENGASAEISMVGKEGMLGVLVVMGGDCTPSRAVTQSAGEAFSLPRPVLKEEFTHGGDLMAVMLRYTQSLITQMAQIAACNRHHTVDQQMCRWLLASLDRRPGNHLQITQEMIANMLGVRREAVNEAAGKLQKRGVIAYKRGEIDVLDREKLESLCCECYAVVKEETHRLLEVAAPGPWQPQDTPTPSRSWQAPRTADT